MTGAARAATIGMCAAAATVAMALLAFTAWQYLAPISFVSQWGMSQSGIEPFRSAFGIAWPRLGARAFATTYPALLIVAWVAYAALIWAGLRGGEISTRTSLFGGAALAVVMAVAFPFGLSVDAYGYVGFARAVVLYGMNPHLTPLAALVGLGDPVATLPNSGVTSPYGPVWTWVCAAVVAALRGRSVIAQALLLKLVTAAGAVALAVAAGALAARIEPGRRALTQAALAFNPLLLIECAGSGHNDSVVMALVVAGLVAVVDGRVRVAALLFGIAGGVKFLPLALLPWLALYALAQARARGRPAFTEAARVAAIGLAPIALAYAPFWGGGAALRSLADRLRSGQARATPLAVAASVAMLAAVYAAATVWFARRPEPLRIALAWIALGIATMVWGAGVWFPWYALWSVAVALAWWTRGGIIVSSALLTFAALLTMLYVF